ncbi:hypothetical protein GCM10011335_02220 [Aureimonas glaciei]|uniref:Uncharacterized protein n=1 Tax=Aureimonas glaciei TaxID=1776957 RepID=A0A916V1N7_9HYPH|nr:hypothetical protein GCM10011335_02220 [Aureimonas glaciei]
MQRVAAEGEDGRSVLEGYFAASVPGHDLAMLGKMFAQKRKKAPGARHLDGGTSLKHEEPSRRSAPPRRVPVGRLGGFPREA